MSDELKITRKLKYFAEQLSDLTWFEMNLVACHIAEQSNHCANQGEEVNEQFVAQLLNDLADDILKAAAQQELKQSPKVRA